MDADLPVPLPAEAHLIPLAGPLATPSPPRAADRHPAAVYLARLAPGSRRTMRQALDAIASLLTSGRQDGFSLDWSQVRYQHSAAVRSALADRYAPASANKILAGLRGVMKECWRLGLVSAEDRERACDLAPVRGETLPRGRSLAAGELQALVGVCRGGGPAGARDVALLSILYGCGLRRAELVALDLADWDPGEESLAVRSGKGRKGRVVYTAEGADVALESWLAHRERNAGPLFCPIRRGGHVALQRMTDQAVLYILRRRAAAAGVREFSPHDCRRTFVGDLLDAGVDLPTVQKMAGHANVATTARYDRRGEKAKRRAAKALHLPL